MCVTSQCIYSIYHPSRFSCFRHHRDCLIDNAPRCTPRLLTRRRDNGKRWRFVPLWLSLENIQFNIDRETRLWHAPPRDRWWRYLPTYQLQLPQKLPAQMRGLKWLTKPADNRPSTTMGLHCTQLYIKKTNRPTMTTISRLLTNAPPNGHQQCRWCDFFLFARGLTAI